jgi:hypothetical protein
MILPTLPLIRAGGDPKGRSGIHGRRRTDPQRQPVNVALEGVWAEGWQMTPGVAAIETLVDAIDLDARPNGAVVPRVDNHVGGPRDAHWARYGHSQRQGVPRLASVA